jgi:hypothetical protein
MILEEGRIVETGRRVDLVQDPRSRFSALLRVGLEADDRLQVDGRAPAGDQLREVLA